MKTRRRTPKRIVEAGAVLMIKRFVFVKTIQAGISLISRPASPQNRL
jgi:hypothetical protein